jgi:hypothetical protein
MTADDADKNKKYEICEKTKNTKKTETQKKLVTQTRKRQKYEKGSLKIP